MIIDVHCHATTPPPQLMVYRATLLSEQARPRRAALAVSDADVAASITRHRQLMQERRIDHALLSPRAGSMGHELGDHRVSVFWAEACNDLVGRVRDMYPGEFSGVCQLPQSNDSTPAEWLDELRRRISGEGFVGCNVNPDISGGLAPLAPPLGDRWWYPLWEALTELNVPAMLHASQTLNPALHMNGSHYINTDWAAVVELCSTPVLDDFPDLKLIIPHGGGAAPFQMARLRALAVKESWRNFEERFSRLYFDTSIYGGPEMDLLARNIAAEQLLYASEMMGTGMAVDPSTGKAFDDNLQLVEDALADRQGDLQAVLHGNAEQLFNLADRHPVSASTERDRNTQGVMQ